jgi:hypothetical protein
MKKIFVFMLMVTLTTGAVFAQNTIYGRARLNLGSDLTFAPENVDPVWVFLPHFRMGVRGSNDNVRYFGQFDINTNDANAHILGTWRANATVNIGDVALSIGRNELPWYRPSSLALFGNNNDGFGASSSNVVGYVTAGYEGVYLGLTSGGRVHGRATDQFPFPGFFLGYDYNTESFSAGAAFAGLYGTFPTVQPNPPIDNYDVFSYMGKAHARYVIAPATIGLNVAFYGAPNYGFHNLGPVASIIGGKDAMVLESMLDLNIRLDLCTIGINGAFIANIADAEKNDAGEITGGGGGSAFRTGFSTNFDVGGGFRLIPGLMYTHFLKGAGGVEIDNSALTVGVTFLFSF